MQSSNFSQFGNSQRFSKVGKVARMGRLCAAVISLFALLAGPAAAWSGNIYAENVPTNQIDLAPMLMSGAENATRHQVFGLFSARGSDFFNQAEQVKSLAGLLPADPSVAKGITIDGTEGPAFAKAQRILDRLWHKRRNDPATLAADMTQLAAYLARQPSALKLLTSLENQPLRLRYRENAFSTEVRGNAFSVHGVTIYFDPRSAARLMSNKHCPDDTSHCVASPADALLHELLHAKIALLETTHFINSGAMQAMIYPYAHEREVIARERGLYTEMSRHDQRPRPQRQYHNGQLIEAGCVTCLGG